MALSFPSNPSEGATTVTGGKTWRFDGSRWRRVRLDTSDDGLSVVTSSAATLTTARTIGGVSFDGSVNINLPGVNTTGNQDTTGSATKWGTYSISVVSALPGSPDSTTVYFVTG